MAEMSGVYCWGANGSGQLGLGFVSEEVSRPEPNQTLSKSKFRPKRVGLGGCHSIIATNISNCNQSESQDCLLTAGANDKGQLGIEKAASTFDNRSACYCEWIKISRSELLHLKVTKVSCGFDFSLVLLESNAPFGCGSNAFGQLGLTSSMQKCSRLQRLSVNQGVKDISAGLRHSLFLDINDEVWGCGSGKFGQLGLGGETKTFKVVKLSQLPPISTVVAGKDFSLFLNLDKSEVWGCGDSRHRQLLIDGTSSREPIFLHRVNLWIQNAVSKVKRLCAGWAHSAVLTNDGRLLLWGRNNYGQLGSETADCFVNELAISDIQDVGLGSEHCLVLTKNNVLLSWGWNEHGNCGLGHVEEKVMRPQVVKVLEEKMNVAIKAGMAVNFVSVEKEQSEM